MSGPRPAAVCWLGLLAVLGGCGDVPDVECDRDADCGPAAVCLRSSCLPRAGPVRWALEIAPGPQSRFAARELPDQALGDQVLDLAVGRKGSMVAELSGRADEGTGMPTSVGVVLAVPSSIAGRPELTFEADGTNLGAASPYRVALAIPEQLFGHTGTLRVLPKAPLDRVMCPLVLGLTLEATAAVKLPGNEDTLMVSGTISRADPTAGSPMDYQARAFVVDRLVSNVEVVGPDGAFHLRLQKSVVAAAAQPVRIELAPVDPMLPAVQFVTTLPAANRGLDNLVLPAYPEPAPFIVPVLDEETDRPVPAVTVIFDAMLEGAAGGQARFSQTVVTDGEGNATVRLIPGTVRQTRDYLVRVLPPAQSPSASRCLATYAVGAVVTEAPRVGAPIKLSRRVALDGRVLRANGRPAGSVRVRAVAEGEPGPVACGGVLAPGIDEATSGSDGRFRILVDPGQYRLEYEPAAGAPVPTASESGVSLLVSRAHVYTLPPAVLVQARVVSPDGDPVEGAEVRAYARGADGRGVVRGLATSGPAGAIQLVLPK